MDYQGAIEVIQDIHDVAEVRIKSRDVRGVVYINPNRLTDLKDAINAMQELQQYKQLGTLEEVREAVERKKPKTPTYDGDGYADGTFIWDEWICPRCGTRYDFEYDDYDYCPNCGQKIDLHADWSEEDD